MTQCISWSASVGWVRITSPPTLNRRLMSLACSKTTVDGRPRPVAVMSPSAKGIGRCRVSGCVLAAGPRRACRLSTQPTSGRWPLGDVRSVDVAVRSANQRFVRGANYGYAAVVDSVMLSGRARRVQEGRSSAGGPLANGAAGRRYRRRARNWRQECRPTSLCRWHTRTRLPYRGQQSRHCCLRRWDQS